PTFLLHSTQLLRDPLLIFAVLIVVWSVVDSLQREMTWRRGLLYGVATVTAIVTIRIVRLPMWYPLCAAVATAIVLLAFRAWLTKRVTGGAIVFALLITAAILGTPRFQPYFSNQQELRARRINFHEKVQQLPILEQINARRRAFGLRIDENGNIVPSTEGSRIDTDVTVKGWGDLLRQLPRALEVGLLAPFPNMWFQTGNLVGIGGRLLAGIETTLTYVI